MARPRTKKGVSSLRKGKKVTQPQYPVEEPRPTTNNRDEVRRETTHRQGHTK